MLQKRELRTRPVVALGARKQNAKLFKNIIQAHINRSQ